MAAYNSVSNRMTKVSPHEIIFGSTMKLPCDVRSLLVGSKQRNTKTLKEFKELIKEQLATLRETAREAQADYDLSRVDKTNEGWNKNVSFAVGEHVMVYIAEAKQGNRSKLRPRYVGPYEITAKINEVTVVVESLVTKDMRTVHITKLKPYYQGAKMDDIPELPEGLNLPPGMERRDDQKEAAVNGNQRSIEPYPRDNYVHHVKARAKGMRHRRWNKDRIGTVTNHEPMDVDTQEDKGKGPKLGSAPRTLVPQPEPNIMFDVPPCVAALVGLEPAKLLEIKQFQAYLLSLKHRLSRRTTLIVEGSPFYARTPVPFAKFMDRVSERYDHGGKVMDLMAGEGGITRYLPRDVIAVEVDSGRVAVGRELVKHAEWVQQDITSLEFIAAYVDAQRHEYEFIVSNPQFEMGFMALAIISELLKPDGTAVVLLPTDFFDSTQTRRRTYSAMPIVIIEEHKVGRWNYYKWYGRSPKIGCDSVYVIRRLIKGGSLPKYGHATYMSMGPGNEHVYPFPADSVGFSKVHANNEKDGRHICQV